MASFKMTKGRLYRKYFNGTTEYEQYDYDTSSGYLYRIQFTAGGTTTTVWQLTGMNEYGNITNANIGSIAATWSYDSNKLLSGITATGVQDYDYSFDVNTGNLNWRTNYLKSKTENFGYGTDKLDRLATVTGPVNQTVGYTTNKNGNIQSKSDAGTYAYNETPYAVSSISYHHNISSTPQTIDYYSFEKVKKITEGSKTADFDYNADHQRIRMVVRDNGAYLKSRYYFGSWETEIVGGTGIHYIWIGGDAYSAVAVAKKVGNGSWTIYNIFRDHLGTITHLKNASTGVVDEYSFDAWGRRRDKDTWTYTLSSEPALFADRGFTAHEFLPDFNLYNMNGRMYDPVVGRFLSPDPFIQAPDFTQSFNRYSYCLNNPLKYSDPSGEFWWMVPVIFAGNYAANWLDNTINKGMSAKEAFRQTPIVAGFNYSPSANQVSLPQLDEFKAAKHEEKVWRDLVGMEASMSGEGRKYKFGSFREFAEDHNLGNGLFGTGIEIGPVGIGLNVELAYPEWIPGLSRNEGFSASFGFVADSKDNLDFYFVDRIPTRNNVTFSIAPEAFYVNGRTRLMYNRDIEGYAYDFGIGLGPLGGSVSSNPSRSYLQWTVTGFGYGIDVSTGHWNSYTHLYNLYGR
ncbi:RHS repeat-associated core domain-containing protein [Sunxiuqinia dokdonensis]|uniref:Bacterial toxin 23 domain-containing protein n=1 Tax=Sunxiuqinia dokdonensis TaxID=1409788 RepID=A0A0L8VFE1_9BACT|nr:RHS repeat-associated core domain-containing protein [Sunxiuqinia dokdonensis]KOH47170.1 hypothetical protein NC99_00030 [Sunxiuqinia dokdonensis]